MAGPVRRHGHRRTDDSGHHRGTVDQAISALAMRPHAVRSSMNPPRRLLSRLRDLMARGEASLAELVRLVAAELASDVCSVYAMRPGDILELAATEGLPQEAVGHTRLRVGEGIVGLCRRVRQGAEPA